MRFLHLADVHLDTPFAGRSARLRAKLRESSREAFRRAVDTALQENVHAVLIAGDLFDGARLSFETERLLMDQLERLAGAGVPVIYASGNHDPGLERGRAASLRWPDNVVLVPDGTPQRIDVRTPDGVVVGQVTAAGHARSGESRDLAAGFPRPNASLPQVALLHARVVGSRREDAHDPYAPTELETLRRSGYHYWALGHVHLRQELSRDPAVHYPGNLQGRTPAETGPKGGLLVDIDGSGSVSTAFRSFAPTRWETLEVGGLETASTADGLLAAVKGAWDAARRDDPAPQTDWMIRVVLLGGTPLWRELGREEDRATLEQELRASLSALDVEIWADTVHPAIDPVEHMERADVLGVVLRVLGATRDGEAPLPDSAMGPWAGWSSDHPEPLSDYVASLLEGAEGELLSRLLGLRDPRG